MSVSVTENAKPLPMNDDEDDHKEMLEEDMEKKEAGQEEFNEPEAPAQAPAADQTFINQDDEEAGETTSDSDSEPDVITNNQQVNLFPGTVPKPGLGGAVAVPKDVGTIVKPTTGKAPEVRVQGDSSHTRYDPDMLDEEKPWLQPGADPSDYFNYGFDEDTWRIYCERQRMIRAGLDPLSARHIMQRQKRPNYADKDPVGQNNNNQSYEKPQNIGTVDSHAQKAANPTLPPINDKDMQAAIQAAAMQAVMAGPLAPGMIPGLPVLPPGIGLPGADLLGGLNPPAGFEPAAPPSMHGSAVTSKPSVPTTIDHLPKVEPHKIKSESRSTRERSPRRRDDRYGDYEERSRRESSRDPYYADREYRRDPHMREAGGYERSREREAYHSGGHRDHGYDRRREEDYRRREADRGRYERR